jgi:hypothetical protein
LHPHPFQYLHLVIGIFAGGVDTGHVSGRHADFFGDLGDPREMRVGDVGHNQPDQARLPAAQGLRGAIRHVADLGNGLLDASDYGIACGSRAVDDRRHGGNCDACSLGYIPDSRHDRSLANPALNKAHSKRFVLAETGIPSAS